MAPPAFLNRVAPWGCYPSTSPTTNKDEEGVLLSLIEHESSIPTLHLLFYSILAYIVYKLLLYPRFLSPLRSLPQPKGGYPILGHSLSRFQQPLGKTYLHFMNTVPNSGLILFRDLFHTDHLLLTSPEALAETLVRKPYHFDKPPEIRLFTSRILGGGLLTAAGVTHKMQRRHVVPSFTLRNTRRLAGLFWRKSEELVDGVKRDMEITVLGGAQGLSGDEEGTVVVDMNVWATRSTLDVFGDAALGLELGLLRGCDHPIVRAYEGAFRSTPGKDLLFAGMASHFRWVVDWIPWAVDKEFDDSTAYLRQFCREAIHRGRQRQRGEQELKKERAQEQDDQPDLLSKMLASGKFTDDELVDQFLTFLAAGHETVAATFGWTIHLLASHPHIQTRVREELRFHASRSGDQMAESLESLPLLHGVCNEAIRLYPSVPITPRVATRETSILNHAVPKDTRIMIAPCAINRSPHLWGSTADEFMPDRWIDAATGLVNKTGGAESLYANLTFLHGAHGCIGADYAKVELRAMVAAFVQAFEMDIRAEDQGRVIVRGRLATRPGDENGRLLIRLKAV
ncbi:cytochrome P450 [Aspergillus affinis]|uniref:cytochrome P450 n=1 Tax=Aspergillus affinis TaxID=1070780 RepID=UPI0022FEAEFF|nr:cytochrome P450 [Aspergillus affinis]KAI9037924.1 cytochrome P450 [Aspergillus affinis]